MYAGSCHRLGVERRQPLVKKPYSAPGVEIHLDVATRSSPQPRAITKSPRFVRASQTSPADNGFRRTRNVVGLSYGIASGAPKGKMKPCQLAARHSRAIAGGPNPLGACLPTRHTKGRRRLPGTSARPFPHPTRSPRTEEQGACLSFVAGPRPRRQRI
jgi:hypothetical protein